MAGDLGCDQGALLRPVDPGRPTDLATFWRFRCARSGTAPPLNVTEETPNTSLPPVRVVSIALLHRR